MLGSGLLTPGSARRTPINHFRFITHLDTFAVIARMHKLNLANRKGEPAGDELEFYRSHYMLLRKHNNPKQDNWLEDLPLHDTEELQKWVSMNRLLTQARKAIYADPAMRALLDPAAPPGRVMLSGLDKQSTLPWHTDKGPYHDRHVRFHVPLVTNPLCSVQALNEQLHMQVGSLWYFNHHVAHTATNFGHHLRIHLVFEMPIVVKTPDEEA